jgi:SMI1-KNR4 cell-wall
MKVALRGGGQADFSDIVALEKVIGQSLDSQFSKFIQDNNGAEPETNSFPVNGIEHMGSVSEFIPIENIIREREYLDGIGPHAYPVASSESGNYVFLDQDQGGAIFFWDHEIQGEISKITNNFNEFLDMIQPFDTSSVEIAPGQVTSAWIDPNFKPEF